MTPIPNSRETAATTAGIARNMQVDIDQWGAALKDAVTPFAGGGGNLNGTAALVFFSQTGTNARQWQRPRSRGNGSGNYCGVQTILTGNEQDGVNLWPIGTGLQAQACTISPIVTLAPDGTTQGVATQVESAAANAGHNYYDAGAAYNAYSTLTFSAYVKPIPGASVRGVSLQAQNSALVSIARADFDLIAGLVTFTQTVSGGVILRASIERADAGFWKCTLASQCAGGQFFGRMLHYTVNPAAGAAGSNATTNFTSDGVSGLYWWRTKETTIGA